MLRRFLLTPTTSSSIHQQSQQRITTSTNSSSLFLRTCFSEIIPKSKKKPKAPKLQDDDQPKVGVAAVVKTTSTKTTVSPSSTASTQNELQQQREELIHEITVKRDVKIDNENTGLALAALDNVNKITFTKSHVIQQSGTPDYRGEVVGVNYSGVPMVRRDPDVARPTTYTSDPDITDTYFELPAGFSREKFAVEVLRENFPLITYAGLGLAAYWYYWPQLYGWLPTLGFIAAAQMCLARFGGGLMSMRNTSSRNHPFILPDECLEGKICLVTGGSSGVGLHTVVGLARRGADVLVGARRDETAFWKEFDAAVQREPGLTKEQKEAIAKRVSYNSVDVSEYHSIRSFLDFVQDRLFTHAKALGRIPTLSTASANEKKNDNNNNNKKMKIDIKKEREDEFARQQELLRQFPPPLDILINNAGCLAHGVRYNSLSVETMLATNVLGPMFLTEMLLPNIRAATKQEVSNWNLDPKQQQQEQENKSSEKKNEGESKTTTTTSPASRVASPFGRVVNVASMAHIAITELGIVQKNLLQKTFDKKDFNFNKRYALTKLLNIYYSDGLARRGVRSVCVTPGGVASSFFREGMPSVQPGGWAHYIGLTLLRTPREGANSVLAAALAKPEKEFVPGVMFTNCRKREHAKSAVACNDRERGEFLDWAKGQLPIKGFDQTQNQQQQQ